MGAKILLGVTKIFATALKLILLILRYHLMERCWQENPDFRPAFESIRQRLQNFIEEKVCGVDVYSDCQRVSKDLFVLKCFLFWSLFKFTHYCIKMNY